MIGFLSPHSLVAIVWGIANAAMVVAIGNQLEWEGKPHPDMPKPRQLQPGKMEFALLPEYAPPPMEKAYGATLARPLFVPTRLPPPPLPPPPPPPKPTMRKGQFQLMGTIVLEDMTAAIVKEVATGKVRRMIQGEVVNGLRLERVETGLIVFTQYDDSEELGLKVLPSVKNQPPSAPPPKAPMAKAENIERPDKAVVPPAAGAPQPGQAARAPSAQADKPAVAGDNSAEAIRKQRASNPLLQGFGF
jgi:hypothetical protein